MPGLLSGLVRAGTAARIGANQGEMQADQIQHQRDREMLAQQQQALRLFLAQQGADETRQYRTDALGETSRHNKAMESAAKARTALIGRRNQQGTQPKPPQPTSESEAERTAYDAVVAANGNVDAAIAKLNSNPTDARKTYGMTRRHFESAARKYKAALAGKRLDFQDVQPPSNVAPTSSTAGSTGDVDLTDVSSVPSEWLQHAKQDPAYAAYLKANGVAI